MTGSIAGESLSKHVDQFNLNFAEGDEASAEERKKNCVVYVMMHDPGRIRTSVSPRI
jgi:hypothetical protein